MSTKIDSSVIIRAIELGEALANVQSRFWFIAFRSSDPGDIATHCYLAKKELRKAIAALDSIALKAEADGKEGVVRDLPRKLG